MHKAEVAFNRHGMTHVDGRVIRSHLVLNELLHDGDFYADMRPGLPAIADEMDYDLLEERVELARTADQRLAQSWRPSLSA
jgi:hypothetical protein